MGRDPRPQPGSRLLRRVAAALILVAMIAAAAVLWDDVVIAIKPGEQGVYWSRFYGGTSPRILSEGTAFKFPWDEITLYDIRVKRISGEASFLALDGARIRVSWAAHYRPRRQLLPNLHQTVGPDYADKMVRPQVSAMFRQVIGNFSPEKIYAYDEKGLLPQLAEVVEKRFDFPMVDLNQLLITELKLTDVLGDAIEGKLVRQQEFLTCDYRIGSEKQELERRRIEASGLRQYESIAGISILEKKAIEATVKLTKSPNTRVIVVGPDRKNVPIIVNPG